MLAVITTDGLSLLPPSTLKGGIATSETSFTPQENGLTAISCATDNPSLFISSANSVSRYDPFAKGAKAIHTTEYGTITCLVSKDKGNTQIFGSGNKVCILECGSGTGKISKTFDSHKSTITSLALSNDATLLASTSADAVHVYNLTLASHTVLRGLPLTGGQKITACAFHPHSRGRLFLGIGRQMAVYDTTRPSAPLKLALMPDGTSGEVVAIACSPFSKTLVAIATTGGDVGLLDLEKDKSPRRNFNVKVPITSLLFSPEGDAIYIGTENGKVLVKSLRALDKPPVAIVVSKEGDRIQGMAIQAKGKATSTDPAPKANTVSSRKPAEPPVPGKRTVSAAESRKARLAAEVRLHVDGAAAATGAATKVALERRKELKANVAAARKAEETKEPTPEPPREKQVFSPVRDPLGNTESVADISVQIESLMEMKPAKVEAARAKENIAETLSALKRARSTSPGKAAPVSRPTSAVSAGRTDPTRPANEKTESAATRTRTKSTASTRSQEVAERQRMRTSSSGTCVPSSSSGTLSSASSRPLSATSSRSSGSSKHRGISAATSRRTPSPDLPSPEKQPLTPPPMKEKDRKSRMRGMGVLGHGTPEVDVWMAAGKGKGRAGEEEPGRRVGFAAEARLSATLQESESEGEDEDAGERSLVISPRRPPPQDTWAPAPSPLRGAPSPGHGSSPQDLLRTIVQDVMYDFQRDTKTEMMGLHLDLVRMGRTWRREMKETMQEYLEELRELREENRRLREENDRLRRGF